MYFGEIKDIYRDEKSWAGEILRRYLSPERGCVSMSEIVTIVLFIVATGCLPAIQKK
ncbi:hypothetical protein HMPREF7545_0245 [Selenomonas noxia ATCC 43541]|nr:hypothetical protein HMPREF7545_0245 [Selenomonas noxia ATCC 43541]